MYEILIQVQSASPILIANWFLPLIGFSSFSALLTSVFMGSALSSAADAFLLAYDIGANLTLSSLSAGSIALSKIIQGKADEPFRSF